MEIYLSHTATNKIPIPINTKIKPLTKVFLFLELLSNVLLRYPE